MVFPSVFIAFFGLQKRYLKEKNEMTVISERVSFTFLLKYMELICTIAQMCMHNDINMHESM